jgi:hypothetical protein
LKAKVASGYESFGSNMEGGALVSCNPSFLVSGVHQYSGTSSVQFIFDTLPPRQKKEILCNIGGKTEGRSFKKSAVVSVRRSL